MTLINSTISGNSAGVLGGGTANGVLSPSLRLVSSTITGDTSNGGGGGMTSSSGTVTFKNTIIATNIGAPGGNCLVSGGTVISHGNSLDSGNDCGFDPTLGDFINTDPAQRRPHADSRAPARKPGDRRRDNAGCPATDQRGVPRRLDESVRCSILSRAPYCAVQPPSMTSSLPVTNDASSEAR